MAQRKYHESLDVVAKNGKKTDFTIMSAHPDEKYRDRPGVVIQLWGHLHLSFELSPQEARDLARHLVNAADATITEPEIIDFQLYRDPEAA